MKKRDFHTADTLVSVIVTTGGSKYCDVGRILDLDER
jgi:hypothetical protein